MLSLEKFGATAIERVAKAVAALQDGNGILLIDDPERENEGDLIYAASKISIEDLAFMIRECSGIICLVVTPKIAKQLDLNLMVQNNTSMYQTQFTVSIEAKHNISTGVSAHDRWQTITTAIKDDAKPDDLRKPGHVFPLISKENGVLERRGHTEGSIDLVKMAGLKESAVLCELMNADGSMKKDQELVDYALEHNLTMVSIDDIYKVRIGKHND
jgi:3,4-dihydroxy 2-butanone 4-phosphate synthase